MYILLALMSKTSRMRWARLAECMVESRNAYQILVGKPEGKRPLEDLDRDGKCSRPEL
jgi:hypothetical protein